MDPDLLRQYMGQGLMPSFQKLSERGSFVTLATTNPPQSPVAWSTFTTGLDPGGHGIYDFVHRDLDHMSPMLSTSRSFPPERVLCLGATPIALDSPKVELLRHGRAFWEVLGDAGVPSTLLMVPATFPPRDSRLTELLSGMGTPDLLGTSGTYQVFTDDPALAKKSLPAAVVHALDFGGGQLARSTLTGPPYDLCEAGRVLELPVEIAIDRRRPVAMLRVGDHQLLIEEKKWSGWVPIVYDTGMFGGGVPGIVRFYLRSLRPFHLYVSPVNIDPLSPALPISIPASYAAELARELGRFYTKEMKPDTKALSAGVLSEEEFLAQVDLSMREEEAMLDRELARFHGGLLFFYMSATDQLSHVYFRALAPDASEHDRKYAHVIPDVYARADAVLSKLLEFAGNRYDVVVMSDHGFAPYEKKVNLNDWLAERGYLAVHPPKKAEKGPLGHIDWANTQAYALGLNGLFLNLAGREPNGVVPPAEAELVMQRLERDLKEFIDPETKAPVVNRLVRPPVGEFRERAPDLLVGYSRGYRSSDESATGMVGRALLEPNHDKWSGDHCIDPVLVPGVLLSTRKIDLEDPSLASFAGTVLDYFDVTRPGDMQGKSLWQKKK
jgi:predicted AlkP superfamily phosphohydrolase/phosphomutase